MDKSRDAWIVGSTGLVGGHALRALLADPHFASVLSVVRRPSGVLDARLEEKVVDFESMARELEGRRTDVAICCLGTTIKQAGSQERFRHIDFDYVLAFAQSALSAGAKHFIVVTALGADAKSRIFYNRVKGELEEALGALGFERLVIARPSFLAGDREALGQPVRGGEKLALRLSRWLRPVIPANYRSIAAADVAAALLRHVPTGVGRLVLPSGAMQRS